MNRLITIFAVLSLLFILSMFYRISSGIIAPSLMTDLHLSAETLGILGGAFFYSFALFQIVLGPLLDRVGPRFVILCCSVVGAGGSILFSQAQDFFGATLGRVLMGVGMAAMLMGSFKVFTLYFPSKSFSTLAGLFVSFGYVGTMAAASPLAYVAAMSGWRITFVWTAAVTLLLGITAFLVLNVRRETVHNPVTANTQLLNLRTSTRLILGSLSFWQIAITAFVRYGTFVSLQGMWLGLYLMDARGFSPIKAGNVLIFLSIGNACGGPLAGAIVDRAHCSEKQVAFTGLVLYCFLLFYLTAGWKMESEFSYVLLSFCLGFFHAAGTLLYAHAKELFPLSIAGTAMAWVNFCMTLGSAVLTTLFGKIVALFPRTGGSYPAAAYKTCFLICSLVMAAGLLFYSFSRSKGCNALDKALLK
ncbi:MAG TPA: MFS transporter [Syntrophorhabdales bacterium]|nr:MFS transporter [Syntrophorhabdales bacterium]